MTSITDIYIIEYNKIQKQSNKTPRDKGRLLELYYCIKNPNYLLWENVPESIKKKYNFTIYDSGIDCALIENDTIKCIVQCKNYNGLLITTDLKGYCYNCLKQIEIKRILCITPTTKLCKQLREDNLFEIQVLDLPYYIPINNNNIENKKNEIILRDYQNDCINKMLEFIKRNSDNQKNNLEDNSNNFHKINSKKFVIKIPCGCGKTIIIHHFINHILQQSINNSEINSSPKILILVPSISLVYQFLSELNDLKCNYLCTNHEDYDPSINIFICCYNSIEKIQNLYFDYVIIDEAHHIQKPRIYNNSDDIFNHVTYIDIIKSYLKYSFAFLFSATIDNPDYVYDLDQAIEHNYLVDYQVEIHYINQDRANTTKELLSNPFYHKTVIYCNKINTCKELNNYLNKNGFKSTYIISEINQYERQDIINKFNNDTYNILCSVNCLSEGINIPCIDTCLFYDDRSSPINIIQCLGRCLRLYPTKIKAKLIVLSDSIDKDNNYNKYLNAINFTDNFFKDDIKNKLVIRDNRNLVNKEITENQYLKSIHFIQNKNKYFETIIIKRYTLEAKLNICYDFYREFKCLPEKNEIYHNLNIYDFIQNKFKSKDEDTQQKLNNIFHYNFKKSPIKKIYGEHPYSKMYDTPSNIRAYCYGMERWDRINLSLPELKKIIFQHHITSKESRLINKLGYNFIRDYLKLNINDFEKGICINRDLHLIDTTNNYCNLFKFFVQVNLQIDVNKTFNGNTLREKKQEFINYITQQLQYILKKEEKIDNDLQLQYLLQYKNNHNDTNNEIVFNVIFFNIKMHKKSHYYDLIDQINAELQNNPWNIKGKFINDKSDNIYEIIKLHMAYQSIDNKTWFENIYNINDFIDKDTPINNIIKNQVEEYVFELSLLNVDE